MKKIAMVLFTILVILETGINAYAAYAAEGFSAKTVGNAIITSAAGPQMTTVILITAAAAVIVYFAVFFTSKHRQAR